jgi:hypothetical protein
MAQLQQVILSCCFTAAVTSVILYFSTVSKINQSAHGGNEKVSEVMITKTSKDIPKYDAHSEAFPWEPTLHSSEQVPNVPRDVKAFLSTMTFASSTLLREPRCPCCK